MNIKSIHQCVSSISYGDGISRGVFLIQKMLIELGYKSNIYIIAIKIDLRIQQEIYHISECNSIRDDIFLVHFSFGNKKFKDIIDIMHKKIMIYHNITPSHFFGHTGYIEGTQGGRKQLMNYNKKFLGVIADSPYNAEETKFCGYKNIISIPLLVDIESLQLDTLDNRILEKYKNSFNIIFVGRIIQNKSQHQLIEIAYELKLRGIENFKVIIIGSNHYSDYLNYMKRNIKLLGLENSVHISEHISDEELNSYYRCASLYLSMSEHEGFGMPLVEAMSYNIPVLAYNTTAITTTVPKCSHLDFKNVDYVANRVIQIMNDEDLRISMIKEQKDYLNNFKYEKLQRDLQNYLQDLGI
ncbi:MAG: glycosyltransferase [Sulfurimonadaceae bacterium]|jgi:glycosyltransferase involved in cell wall biosynthesis|nr:glycosyltransferase [Sulfurimonadaceae bacterium]